LGYLLKRLGLSLCVPGDTCFPISDSDSPGVTLSSRSLTYFHCSPPKQVDLPL
jgi:hypothetical protein